MMGWKMYLISNLGGVDSINKDWLVVDIAGLLS